MDQIIKAISEKLGISESVARDATKVLLEFARKQIAGTKFEKILAGVPGASALFAEAPDATSQGGGGFLSGLGGSLGDAAKAFSSLQSAGLQSAQIGPFVQAFLEKSREIAGPEVVDEFLKQVPMLKTLVKF
ncbi:MAG TPA: DUF2780 domain-containing protein [Terrimicrobiaceae bacterium]